MFHPISKLALLCVVSCAVLSCYSTQTCCCGESGERTTKTRERVSPEDQIIVAHHEASHAVFDMALLPKRGVSKLEVFSKVNVDRWPGVRLLGLMTPGDGPMEGDHAYQHRALALISLAGSAAEDVLFHKTPPDSDPDSDNSAFESLAYCEAAHCACPPESRIGNECLMTGLLKPGRERLYAEAKACVEANKVAIVKLANLVILKKEDTRQYVRTLDVHELQAFFAANPLNTEACRTPRLPSSTPMLVLPPPKPPSPPTSMQPYYPWQ